MTYRSGKLEYRARRATEPEHVLAGYLDRAREIFAEAREAPEAGPPLSEDFESLRWFPLPHELAS